jgi:uncharacterized protein YcbX
VRSHAGHVSRLTVAPVKGMALVERDELELGRDGVAENRRFLLLDEAGRHYAALRDGRLLQIRPEAADGRLALRFPDGARVAGDVAVAEPVTVDLYGRDVACHVVAGPWAEAVSRFAGRPLRLVRTDGPGAGVDRGRGPVTMVSRASLDELARRAGAEAVDGRRFRMLVGIDGVAAHEEDSWVGRLVRVGDAVVRPLEPVARCAVTTKNPDTGVVDFDSLREIRGYRGPRPADGRSIDFGVFGEVVESGRVRVGDAVAPVD